MPRSVRRRKTTPKRKTRLQRRRCPRVLTNTAEARKEATRDGVPPIELVDGQKMIDMFSELELGLKPIKTFEIDSDFFKEFQ